jgi:predicted nucleotidyltransferase
MGSALADALFGATQQRVLTLLFGQPDRSFYTNEIIALAGAGRGAVQRELSRLSDSDLVSVKKLGNQKHYQANPDSPLFGELCSIIQKTVGLQEPIRTAIEPLADRLQLGVLYGSIAKRTDTATSDVDLLFVSNSLTLEELITTLAPVEKLLDRQLNSSLYTPQEFSERLANRNSFLNRVLAGPYVTLVGSIDGKSESRKSGEDR